MPYGDMTGPEGQGPMTGRGMGICVDSETTSEISEYPRRNFRRGVRGARSERGFGRGAGFGRGRGFGFGLGRGCRWF